MTSPPIWKTLCFASWPSFFLFFPFTFLCHLGNRISWQMPCHGRTQIWMHTSYTDLVFFFSTSFQLWQQMSSWPKFTRSQQTTRFWLSIAMTAASTNLYAGREISHRDCWKYGSSTDVTMHLKLQMSFSNFVSSAVDNALYGHVCLIIFGSVISVVVAKGFCKDYRVLYSHGKKGGLCSLSGILRSVCL